ncbi:chloramphenicol resistance protein, partial [Pseudoxanthomonas sp. SGD-10]
MTAVLKYVFSCVAAVLISFSAYALNREVASPQEVYKAVQTLKPGDTLFLQDGIYKDIQLVIHNSGEKLKPIVISAKNGGKVFFTGDVKVELRGEHIVLKDIYF